MKSFKNASESKSGCWKANCDIASRLKSTSGSMTSISGCGRAELALEVATGMKEELIAGGGVANGGEERLEQLFQGKEETTIADPTRVTRLAK